MVEIKSLFVATVAFVATAISTQAATETVLFDASKDAAALKSARSDIKIEKAEDGALLISEPKAADIGAVALCGKWDLSKFDKIVLDVEAVAPKSFMFTISTENAHPDFAKKKDYRVDRVVIDGKAKIEIWIKPPAKYSDVYELVKDTRKMRGTPFQDTRKSDFLNYSDVRKIRIYPSDARRDTKWKISKISAVADCGKDYSSLPSWYSMSKEQFFPFIDKYGQFIHKQWQDKVHSDADFQAMKTKEAADLAANPSANDRDKWGGWAKGPSLRATGHFRVEKLGGKWWMVDPDGKLFWSHGVVRVTPSSAITPLDGRKLFFKDLPAEGDEFAQFYHTRDELLYPYYVKRNIKETYDYSAANIFRKYGKDWRNQYADICHKRLASWGLNTIANSSDKRIYMLDRTPYIDRFEIKAPELAGSGGYWWAFRDPFNPAFRENIRKNLAERADELADPWCIGIFVDNELNWGNPDSHAVWTIASDENTYAKKFFAADLKEKYGTIENLNRVWGSDYASWSDFMKSTAAPKKGAYDDCVAFSQKVIEEYFKVIRSEVKLAAPHILYMGCRFAGVPKNNPQAIYIAAKYCDVLSNNIYRDVLDEFGLPSGIDKPIMIGEFHFGALDRGKFHTGLVPKSSQSERAQSYYNYVESALRNPNVIGTHWHQFSDQATTGRFDGENFQVGFTDVCDTPYWETISKIRDIGYKMYDVRSGK